MYPWINMFMIDHDTIGIWSSRAVDRCRSNWHGCLGFHQAPQLHLQRTLTDVKRKKQKHPPSRAIPHHSVILVCRMLSVNAIRCPRLEIVWHLNRQRDKLNRQLSISFYRFPLFLLRRCQALPFSDLLIQALNAVDWSLRPSLFATLRVWSWIDMRTWEALDKLAQKTLQDFMLILNLADLLQDCGWSSKNFISCSKAKSSGYRKSKAASVVDGENSPLWKSDFSCCTSSFHVFPRAFSCFQTSSNHHLHILHAFYSLNAFLTL